MSPSALSLRFGQSVSSCERDPRLRRSTPSTPPPWTGRIRARCGMGMGCTHHAAPRRMEAQDVGRGMRWKGCGTGMALILVCTAFMIIIVILQTTVPQSSPCVHAYMRACLSADAVARLYPRLRPGKRSSIHPSIHSLTSPPLPHTHPQQAS